MTKTTIVLTGLIGLPIALNVAFAIFSTASAIIASKNSDSLSAL